MVFEMINLHRRPSVITCSQSLLFWVSGHLNSAPDLFVCGCRFCPSGAPTNNLKEKEYKKRPFSLGDIIIH